MLQNILLFECLFIELGGLQQIHNAHFREIDEKMVVISRLG
jgi:hypothetical protein